MKTAALWTVWSKCFRFQLHHADLTKSEIADVRRTFTDLRPGVCGELHCTQSKSSRRRHQRQIYILDTEQPCILFVISRKHLDHKIIIWKFYNTCCLLFYFRMPVTRWYNWGILLPFGNSSYIL